MTPAKTEAARQRVLRMLEFEERGCHGTSERRVVATFLREAMEDEVPEGLDPFEWAQRLCDSLATAVASAKRQLLVVQKRAPK